MSNEMRKLTDWNCPVCTQIDATFRPQGRALVTEHITSQSKLIAHLNIPNKHGTAFKEMPEVWTDDIGALGITLCATCQIWMCDSQLSDHMTSCDRNAAPQQNEELPHRDGCDNDNDTIVDATSTTTTETLACELVTSYRLYTSGRSITRNNTTMSGIAGIITGTVDETEHLIVEWSETISNLKAREAAWVALRTGIETALQYGIVDLNYVLCDDILTQYSGYMQAGEGRLRQQLDLLIDQLNHYEVTPEGHPELRQIVRSSADHAMTALVSSNNMRVKEHNIAMLPPSDKTLSDVYGTSRDHEFDTELASESVSLSDRLARLNDDAVSSEPLAHDPSLQSMHMPPQPCNSIDDNDMITVRAICAKWTEWIGNAGPSLTSVPKDCISALTCKSRQLLTMYFDETLSWAQRATAFCHYLALPKMTLSKHKLQRGRSHSNKQAVARTVRDRVGAMGDLTDSPPSSITVPTRSRSARETEVNQQLSAAISRSSKLFADGHIGRSARTLASVSTLGDLADPSVQREMHTKHPRHKLTADAVNLLHDADGCELRKMDELAFRQILNKMDNGSAAGYDGWSAGMLKSLMKDAENLALHIKLLHDISNGRIISPLASMLQRGRLVALTKQPATRGANGEHIAATHRPIMISTCLYRLTAKLVNDSIKGMAATKLSPLQLGIATPGAIEAAVHTTREVLTNEPTIVSLKLDTANAFNSVSRSHMITRVMTEEWLKPARAFVKMSYGEPTPILMPDAEGRYLIENDMMSTQGVRQGDPLASLLFACALQTALEEIQKHINDNDIRAWILAYHDDTQLLGEPEDIIELLRYIEHKFAQIDLYIQPEKSRLVDFHWDTRSPQFKEQVAALHIAVDDECTVFLGCPIGKTPQAEAAFMKSKLVDQTAILPRLADPRVSIHQAATILRVSTVHKLDHWLRNVEPDVMLPIARQFDDKVRQCLYDKLDLNQQIAAMRRAGDERNMHELTRTPISLGGDGITRTADTAHICWVAGVASAMVVPTAINAFQRFDDGQPVPDSHIHGTLNDALHVVKDQCCIPPQALRQSASQQHGRNHAARSHSNPAPYTGATRSVAGSDRLLLMQNEIPEKAEQLFHLMSGANHRAGSKAASQLLRIIRQRQLLAINHRRRVQEDQSSNITRARLLAIRAKGATRIMTLRGTSSKVSDCSYQTHFSMRHGISLSLSYNEHCHGCNNDIRNIPNHELGCVRGFGSEINTRHNLIRNTIERTMTNIGGVANREPNPFADTRKRPDIEWFIDGRRIFFDVSVTHPLNSTIVVKAAHKQLAAADDIERKKNNKYHKLCQDLGAEFIPIVIESFGGYGRQFGLFLTDLRKIAQTNLTLTDGDGLINEMLNQIAYHVIGLNGLIMKMASSSDGA